MLFYSIKLYILCRSVPIEVMNSWAESLLVSIDEMLIRVEDQKSTLLNASFMKQRSVNHDDTMYSKMEAMQRQIVVLEKKLDDNNRQKSVLGK